MIKIIKTMLNLSQIDCSCGPGSAKGPFPDLVTVPISEEDTQGFHHHRHHHHCHHHQRLKNQCQHFHHYRFTLGHLEPNDQGTKSLGAFTLIISVISVIIIVIITIFILAILNLMIRESRVCWSVLLSEAALHRLAGKRFHYKVSTNKLETKNQFEIDFLIFKFKIILHRLAWK